MYWYTYFSIFSAIFCLMACAFLVSKILKLAQTIDYSASSGSTREGVIYSYTKAMNPKKKESAYLHLPTYSAGLIFHLGTFLCLMVYVIQIWNLQIPVLLQLLLIALTIVSTLSGIGIFFKRLINKGLNQLSNPDDYFSNSIVTMFQLLTMVILINPDYLGLYHVFAGVLFLYIPFGKLKHAVFFFAARYHLGYFFGRRGVWPIKTF